MEKLSYGYPFVDQGNVDVDSEVREYRGMSSVIRQDMAAFLYRWAGSPGNAFECRYASFP